MSRFDENLKVFQTLKPTYTRLRVGYLGRYNADGSVDPDPQSGLTAEYTWVRFAEDRGATRVKNLTVRAEWGTPVWVGFNELTREDEVREVHGVLAPAVMGGGAAAGNVPAIPANVPTPVTAGDVLPGSLKADSAGGLNVRVLPAWIPGGRYWDGSTIITLTPTATSSMKSLCVVGIDPATGLHTTSLTTDRGLAVSLVNASREPTAQGAADIKTVCDADTSIWWVGAVELANGATTINPARIVDRRFWDMPTTGTGYTTVEDEGSAVTARSTMNFTGAGVSVADSGGKTVVTISGGSGGVGDYILIRDEKTQNTNGGTFTSGAWQTRDLNTESSDAGGHASISSNQITLAAGTYRAHIVCPAYFCGLHQAKLYNISDSADVLIGTASFSPTTNGDVTLSVIMGRFTIAATKTLEVQHQCATTSATYGFGAGANFTTEVFTVVELIKES